MKAIHLFACAAVLAASPLTFAQSRPQGISDELPLRIVGSAVSGTGIGNPAGMNRVVIRVTGTSPVAQRDRMREGLKAGQQRLLSELRDGPPVGSIQFGTNLAWDVRYVQRTRREDGGVRIALMTDRPMGAYELWNTPRYSEYPFTLITLNLDANGRGTGEMILAARITAEPSGEFIFVENYASDPIRLNGLETEVER